MLKVARYFKPDNLVVLGDFADCKSVSAHDDSSLNRMTLKEEMVPVNRALDELDGLGASRKIFVCGNHSQRIDRYLVKNAPALDGLLTVPMLLGLKARGWEYVPYRKSIRIGKIHVTHDVGGAGKNAHRSASVLFGGSAIIGHTHRMAYEVSGRFDGDPYLACMLGWLGDDSAADYLHQAQAAEWVRGFGLGWEESNGITHVQPVPIVKGKCVVNGRMFK